MLQRGPWLLPIVSTSVLGVYILTDILLTLTHQRGLARTKEKRRDLETELPLSDYTQAIGVVELPVKSRPRLSGFKRAMKLGYFLALVAAPIASLVSLTRHLLSSFENSGPPERHNYLVTVSSQSRPVILTGVLTTSVILVAVARGCRLQAARSMVTIWCCRTKSPVSTLQSHGTTARKRPVVSGGRWRIRIGGFRWGRRSGERSIRRSLPRVRPRGVREDQGLQVGEWGRQYRRRSYLCEWFFRTSPVFSRQRLASEFYVLILCSWWD